jgi:sialic acid synthase SpsE
MSIAPVRLGDRPVGPGHHALVVAELSANHGGSLDRAQRLIRAAHAAGADAIKLQTFDPEDMAPDGLVLRDGPWKGRALRDLYREAVTPWAWHADLFALARDLGMLAFSSATSVASAERLVTLGVPCVKVASFELTHEPLLRRLATLARPVLLSTGMASDPEIRQALDLLHPVPVVLLHCVSAYPVPLSHANLPRLAHLREAFARPVGLSWHNTSLAGPVVAAAMGAAVVEVHVQDGQGATPDGAFSLLPHELRRMVELMREVESLGSGFASEVDQPQRALRRPASGGARGTR